MPARRPPVGVLRGEGIQLAPLTPADFPALYLAIGHPEVFAGGYGGGLAGLPANETQFVEFAKGYFDLAANNVYGVWRSDEVTTAGDRAEPNSARGAAGRLVGTSTLGDFDLANESSHIGWTAYDPALWGTAVNPETKLLMLGEAFDHGFGRVKLQADVLNSRSRAAMLKLGARFEGITRRERPRADGTWRDTAVYSILADEWPEVRAGLLARLDRLGA